MPNKKQLILALAIFPAILMVKIIGLFPEFVERFYSNGIYLFTSKLSRLFLGWMPFSFGDIMYSGAIILIIRWLYLNRKQLIKSPLLWVTSVASVISIVYISFNILWGLNYYRLPLHEKLNLNKEYTTAELEDITNLLITKSNDIHFEITKNDTVKVVMPYSKKDMLKAVPKGYSILEQKFSYLKYTSTSIKPSLLSLLITYMGTGGYLNPFTNEAQINHLIPAYRYPVVASHEVAHQLGYAAENEANFIGFLAATHHKDIYFKYSGYIFALRYCINELYRRDEEKYCDAIALINKGIKKNYQESRTFWENYENPFEPIARTVYTSYLKANSQSKGMKSYSYVVALLVNYFKNKNL